MGVGEGSEVELRVDGSSLVVTPSARGELEILDTVRPYMAEGELRVQELGRGFAWLDTGTHASLLDAANFVRTLTERQGQQVGSPDEIAYRMGFISGAELERRAARFEKNSYGQYLAELGA